MFHEGTMDVGLMQRKSIFQDTIDPESIGGNSDGIGQSNYAKKIYFVIFF